VTMEVLTSGEFIIFALLSIVALASTYQMVAVRLITHAALFMTLTFTAVAGIFLLLQAEFVAGLQVLIYSGAITTMVIFAIMLSGLKDIKAEAGTKGRGWSKSNPMLMIVGLIFATFMCYLYAAANLPKAAEAPVIAKVKDIGLSLFSTYVIPFEVASILLLIAMVGAIILTAKEAE
jgi:NADH-quinone oxidoreductase subunit J